MTRRHGRDVVVVARTAASGQAGGAVIVEGGSAGSFRRRGGGGTFFGSHREPGRDLVAGRGRRWPSGLAYRSTAALGLYANLKLKARWRRRIAYN